MISSLNSETTINQLGNSGDRPPEILQCLTHLHTSSECCGLDRATLFCGADDGFSYLLRSLVSGAALRSIGTPWDFRTGRADRKGSERTPPRD